MAANAFGNELVAQRQDLRTRLRYFPNPYGFDPALSNDRTLLPTLREWRSSLLRAAHTVVIFDGGMGTETEAELALEMDCIIIPVPTAPDGFARKLLTNKGVRDYLDADYLNVADGGTVTAADVLGCVARSFRI